jgi:UDP-N-acetylmuramate dehydrogenase
MNIQPNHSLRAHNSFAFDVRAEHFARAQTLDELDAALSTARNKNWPMLPLGGGSNLLLTRDVPGLVLLVDLPRIDVLSDDGDAVRLRVGAGENWHALVLHTLEQGWQGLENLALIPGTAGAAPIQNIGAYGVELVDVFESLDAVEIASGAWVQFSRDDCRFGYRDSVFKRGLAGQFIITSVTLKLSRNGELNTRYGGLAEALADIESPSARDVADAVIHLRRSKLPDPAEIGNAGSFFQNPVVSAEQFAALREQHPNLPHYPQADGRVKLAAGWLVEQAGWKGHRDGAVGVHARQSIVLVHHFADGANGTGAQVLALAERIRADIFERFGVRLEIEPRVI